MGIVTEAGFYGGKFLKSGQFYEADVETVATGVAVATAAEGLDLAALAAMSKDELLVEAERRGVPAKPSDTKAEIIDALSSPAT